MKVHLRRINDSFHLEAANDSGQFSYIDGSPDIGGGNLAFRPMQMVLAALGGCSSIDVILLLNKQRQDLRHLEIEVEGDREADAVPAVFTHIRVHYKLYGTLDPKKVERACRLSVEKLCSVSKMLEKTADISWTYEILPATP